MVEDRLVASLRERIARLEAALEDLQAERMECWDALGHRDTYMPFAIRVAMYRAGQKDALDEDRVIG